MFDSFTYVLAARERGQNEGQMQGEINQRVWDKATREMWLKMNRAKEKNGRDLKD